MRKIVFFLGMAMAAIAANAATIFVKADASGSADGTSWANAYTDVSAAITAAAAGDVIYVAGGTFNITASLPYKAVSIYGGFIGNEENPDPAVRVKVAGGKPWELTSPTVLDASGWTGDDKPIFEAATAATELTLDGLTLKSRTTTASDVSVISARVGLTVQNCILTDNTTNGSTDNAGAIYIQGSEDGTIVIKDSKISNSVNKKGAGAIRINQSKAVVNITGCRFEDNKGGGSGGIWLQSVNSLLLEKTELIRNVSDYQGGGIRVNGGKTEVKNCIFDGNKSGGAKGSYENGSAIYREGGQCYVFNSVFTKNGSDNYSPKTIDGGSVYVYNSIFVGNKGDHLGGSNNVLSYGMFDGALPAGEGNIAYTNGVFTDLENGDYTLAENSPAKGAGKFTIPFSRVAWGQVDIGVTGNALNWEESPYFHLVFERRFGGLLKDNGSGTAPTAQRVYPSATNLFTDSLQWKFIRSGTYVKVQSKLGNYLDMSSATLTTQGEVTTDARSIFKFELSTGQVPSVQLRGNYPNFGSVVNKASSGDGVAGWGSTTTNDNGNALTIASQELMPAAMPALNKWYQIYTLAGASSRQPDTKVWQGNGTGQKITNVAPEPISAQLWRFVEVEDGVKVQNVDGAYFKKPSVDQTNTEAEGDILSLTWNEYSKNTSKGGSGLQRHWALYNSNKSGDNSYICAGTNYYSNNQDRELEFVEPNAHLTVNLDTLTLGSFFAGAAAADLPVVVDARFLSSDVTYAIEGSSKDNFSVAPADGWSAKRGGTLTVTFTPPSGEGEYKALLIVKGTPPAELGGELVDTVVLTASVAQPMQLTINAEEGVTVTRPVGTPPVYTVGQGTVIVTFSISPIDLPEASIGLANPQPLDCEEVDGQTGSYRITLKNLSADTAITIRTLHQDVSEKPLVISSGDNSNEAWYYVKFEKRDWSGAGQVYLYDQGAGEPLIVVPSLNLHRKGAQWKIVAGENPKEYKLVSKRGHEVAYTAAALTGDSSSVLADRFFAAPASTNRFKLIVDDTHTAYYQLSLVGVPAKSISKGDVHNQFSGGKGGDGTAVSFIPVNNAKEYTDSIDNRFPVIATGKDKFYYNISFANRTGGDWVFTDRGRGEDVMQDPEVAGSVAQAWKLKPLTDTVGGITGGVKSEFYIESMLGNQFAATSSDANAQALAKGSPYTLVNSTHATTYSGWWLLKRTGGTYLNNYGGMNATGIVREYSQQGDAGSVIKFAYVEIPVVIEAQDKVECGSVTINKGRSSTRELTVTTLNLPIDTLVYVLAGKNPERFAVVKKAGWDTYRGGTLSIIYTPDTTVSDDSATLIIKSVEDEAQKTVLLTGNGAEGAIVNANPVSLSFAGVTKGKSSELKTITLEGLSLEPVDPNSNVVITYALAGSSGSAFAIDRTTDNVYQIIDGVADTTTILRVAFRPADATEYRDTIIVTGGGLTNPKRIPLHGVGVTPALPVPADGEEYYYIQLVETSTTGANGVISGGFVQDVSAGSPVRTPATISNGCLWKVTATDTTNRYRLVSKQGNELSFHGTSFATAAAGSGSDFDFEASGGYWKVKHRGASDSYLKRVDDTYSPDATIGAEFRFLPEASVTPSPTLSVGDAERWYLIEWQNTLGYFVEDKGANVNLERNTTADSLNVGLFWKLTPEVGKTGSYKVVAYSGREFKLSDGSNEHRPVIAADVAGGHSFALEWTTATASEKKGWTLRNLSLPGTFNYLTFMSNISQYNNNPDRLLNFVEVPQTLLLSDAGGVAVSGDTVPFGVVSVNVAGVTTAKTFSVRAYNLGAALEYTLTGDDAANFTVTPSADWNSTKGGTATITFAPTANVTKDYSATLTIRSANNAKTRTLTLTGRGAPTYTFTAQSANAEWGSVTPESGIIEQGAEVTLTATPTDTTLFVSWANAAGDTVSTNNPFTLTLTQDTSLTAVFEFKPKYIVAVAANNPELGSATGSGSYFGGSTATLTATPATTDVQFVAWVATMTGDTVSKENPYTITVMANTVLTAFFKQSTSIVPPVVDVPLNSLEVSAGTLTPNFHPDTLSYAVSVGNAVTSIIITATVADGTDAIVAGDGEKTLEVGANTLTITVTSGSAVRTYTITVTREAAAPPVTGVSSLALGTLTIYPNPVTGGLLTIENGALKSGDRVEIYAISGSLAATYEVSAGKVTTINVSRLPKGAYIVKLGACAAKLVVN